MMQVMKKICLLQVGRRVFGWDTAGLSLLTNWGPIAYLLGTFAFSWILDEKGKVYLAQLNCLSWYP